MGRGLISSQSEFPSRCGRIAVAVALLLVFGLLPLTSHAQQNDGGELDKLRREIAALRERLGGLETRRTSAEQDLERLDVEVAIAERELELLAQARTILEQDRHQLAERIADLEHTSRTLQRQVSQRLDALYRLGSLGYLRLLLSVSADSNPFEAMSMLAYLISRDGREMQRLKAVEKELAERRTELMDRSAVLERVDNDARRRSAELARVRRQQQALVRKLQQEAERSSARLVQLEEKAKRLERLFDLLYTQESAAADHDVRQFRGVLAWPVEGKVISRFGRQRSDRFATYTMNNGIRIAAAENAEVRAVFPGRVLFARWFRGYGNLVIIDHGQRVFSLYGNTRMSVVQQGDEVRSGQVIATVADGDADELPPHLYFEIREDNRPVDPVGWIR